MINNTYGATAPYGLLPYKGELPPIPFTDGVTKLLLEQYRTGYTNSGGSYFMASPNIVPKTPRIIEDLGTITNLLVTQYKTNYIN
jgi:hypothetical protein